MAKDKVFYDVGKLSEEYARREKDQTLRDQIQLAQAQQLTMCAHHIARIAELLEELVILVKEVKSK